MAPALHLIFLLIIHMVSSAEWAVNYSHTHICALKNSSVILSCTYTYPTGHQIIKVFWTKDNVKGKEPIDLSKDPEYSQRLQYLGDEQQNCTVRLSHVTKKDEHEYHFRFTTNVTKGSWTGSPGVRLSVTDLQLESPERVTEGDSVRLTCKSSCKLTDTPTFIWYRNSHTLTIGDELNISSVRREDAGRYRCAVHTLTSPEVYLNVIYPPRSVSVSISKSVVIIEGDSVTLSCSSDSNNPALKFSWFKVKSLVGSGRIFNISKISSDDSEKYKCKVKSAHVVKYSDPVILNVQYPPRNVSVSVIDDSGQLWFDSASLMCISDSNPPALNFSWFKENQSSAVGSGQSFSAVQSGRFYCEAHNPHGVQRSDTVTVHQGSGRNATVITVTSAALLIIIFIIILCIIKKQRSVKSEGLTVTQNDLYSDPGSAGDALYASVNPRRGRAAECRDAEEIQYATVQYHKNTQMKREEEEEQRQCDIKPVQQPDQDHSRSNAETVQNSVIYSSVR
ncbi:B-cell receptor CD22-like [Danio aesculapii]|uniref:B-cell receptor CD22-like n=1 Tax=Danio aesculapii TaxID=1142201 RepID=UPI0024BF9F84|nr:B-cell receptor CD22-like [Danio aesculapii]